MKNTHRRVYPQNLRFLGLRMRELCFSKISYWLPHPVITSAWYNGHILPYTTSIRVKPPWLESSCIGIISDSDPQWIVPSKSLKLSYTLFRLKQAKPNMELITCALLTQIVWDLLDLKEDSYRYFLVKF